MGMKLSERFGICQGRLTSPPNNELQWFPGEKWPNEFYSGSELGYSFIELLAERAHNKNNPLWKKSEREKIIKVSQEANISIYSACLDYIIDHSFFSENNLDIEIINYSKSFINSCEHIGIKLVVLPFLEESSLTNDNANLVIKYLEIIGEYANKKGIEIALESIARPEIIIEVLENIQGLKIGVVFDTGNRVLISDNLSDEIKKLSKFINHVHLKDRDLNNKNVIIGTGIVDFVAVFQALKNINYNGKYSFESNRGNNVINTAKHNLDYIKFIFVEVFDS